MLNPMHPPTPLVSPHAARDSSPFLNGQHLTGIVLPGNVEVAVEHKLGRDMIGWVLADNIFNVAVWRVWMPVQTVITLTSDGPTVVAVWVF